MMVYDKEYIKSILPKSNGFLEYKNDLKEIDAERFEIHSSTLKGNNLQEVIITSAVEVGLRAVSSIISDATIFKKIGSEYCYILEDGTKIDDNQVLFKGDEITYIKFTNKHNKVIVLPVPIENCYLDSDRRKCTICDKEVAKIFDICPFCGHDMSFKYKINQEEFDKE